MIMRAKQAMMDKRRQKILQESHIPLIRKADFFDWAGMSVDFIHAGRPSKAGERGHVEGLLVGGIAVFRSVGAGVSVEAAAVAA
jgi:hypothetical protein